MPIVRFYSDAECDPKLTALLAEAGFSIAEAASAADVALVVGDTSLAPLLAEVESIGAWVAITGSDYDNLIAAMRRVISLRRTNGAIEFGQVLGDYACRAIQAYATAGRDGVLRAFCGARAHVMQLLEGQLVVDRAAKAPDVGMLERVLLWTDPAFAFVPSRAKARRMMTKVPVGDLLDRGYARIDRLSEVAPNVSVRQVLRSEGSGRLTADLQSMWLQFQKGRRVEDVLDSLPSHNTLAAMQTIDRLVQIGRLSPLSKSR